MVERNTDRLTGKKVTVYTRRVTERENRLVETKIQIDLQRRGLYRVTEGGNNG